MKIDYYVHPSSVIDEPVSIGKGTKIWHFCHIMSGTQIGENCKIGQNIYIDKDVKIGNNVKIQNNVSVYKGVTLQDNVFCGPSVVFTNVMNPRSAYPRKIEEYDLTLVKEGASIGANSTIVCGCSVGRYAFIGAGSVVTRDVPDYALFYGIPAKEHGFMCECGVKLKSRADGKQFQCPECDKKYNKTEEGRVERQ